MFTCKLVALCCLWAVPCNIARITLLFYNYYPMREKIEEKLNNPDAVQGWIGQAACRGMTDTFFSPYNESAKARERRENIARNMCASCPVIEQCLEQSSKNEEYGIWGGLNELERLHKGFPSPVKGRIRIR